MTQIAVSAGSPASVTLAAGSKLLITGQGTYRIGPRGTSQRPSVDELIDTFVTVGPFEDSCTVQIWATGAGATYEVSAPTDGVDQTGRPLVSGGGNESQYTKGLYFGNPLPQAGSVKDFSRSNNDLVYAGGTTDAEVYGPTSPVYYGSATYDPGSLATGAGVTATVTVTGAALGDQADASFSLDLQGITFTAWVSAANTVSVRFQNDTGGTLDLASGTIRASATNTRAGVLSVLGGIAGAGTAKALCMAIAKLQWNLAAGESLFVQARVKAAAISANQPFFGNTSNGTRAGFQLQQGAANTVQMRVRCGATGPQDLGSTTDTMAADTMFNVTLWIDGTTKLFNGWMNGKTQPNWTNKAFSADGTGYTTLDAATPVGFVLGNAGDTTFPNARVSFATGFAALRVAIIPAGLTLQNAALLDWKFNRDPMRILTDVEVVTVAG